MASLHWITIFVQLIFLTYISTKCNILLRHIYNDYKQKDERLREIYCEHVDINNVLFSEYNNRASLHIINITESNTQLIHSGTFHSMYYSQWIYIRNSNISEITKGVFTGLNFLEIIDVSTNNISRIEPNSFSRLSSLRLLNISQNNLQSVDFLGDGFKCNITTLDLSHNKISNISDKFAVLTELRVLNLTDNLISNLDDDCFSNLNWLESLNLAENQIKQIPVGFFKDMRLLNFLNLSNNNISLISLGSFGGLSSLKIIDLSFNKIKSFSADILHDVHNVNAFYISNNYLSDLNARILLNYLPVLQYISLDGNNWTCNKLSEIISNLRSKRVALQLGRSFTEKNINGIACSGETDNEATKQTVNVNGNQNFEVGLEKLKRYFASDFKQSKFYQFFNNKFPEEIEDSFKDAHLFKHVDDDFLNSKFYKYLAEGFINSTFFEYLDKKIETMKISHTLDNIPFNKSDYVDLLKNTISEYFDSLKPSNDYLRDVDAEEKDNNTMLKTQNKLMIVLILFIALIWITLMCKYWKVNETKKLVVNFLRLRQSRKGVQNSEDQLL